MGKKPVASLRPLGNFELNRDFEDGRSGFATRLAIYYGGIFLIVGSFTPYFPVWLDARGMSSGQIGFMLAVPLFIRVLFTPAVSFAADRIGDHRLVLKMLSWGTFCTMIILIWCDSFWQIFAAALIISLFWTTIMPLTETLAMTGVRLADLDYGRMRLWGSLTFIVASLGGGYVIEGFGALSSIWLFITAAALLLLASQMLPRPKGLGRLKAATTGSPIRFSEALSLARSPIFLLFLITSSLVSAGHAIYYSFGTLHWQTLGISTGTIGALWAIGVIAEIVLFAYSRPVVARIGSLNLILIAGFAAVLRWSVTATDPPLALLMPLQILHGLTFGAAHLGSIYFISESVPAAYAATAQGLYAAFAAGLVMGAAMLGAGTLYDLVAGKAYFVMAAMGVLSVACSFLLIKLWNGKPLFAERTD